MSKFICRLDANVACQIAAGEVIERPVSVVKELLENALDAKASEIRIDIEGAGLSCIAIEDNGEGIWAEDLLLALEPHSTSKIKTLNDLYHIHSKGFRGEALASIASVAKVNILSKPPAQAHAMNLVAIDGKYDLKPAVRHQGTTIACRDLFYNVPVRKKFLKSAAFEWQAIESLVKKFALSSPQVQLSLYHEKQVILNFPAAHVHEEHLFRIRNLWGRPFYDSAIAIDVERSGMRIWGWLSPLNLHRSQNNRLWVYLNGRIVQDKLIMHALKQLYARLLPQGRHPQCVLYLELPSDMVDINVHPAKHEVRFEQPRLIYDFILTSLKPHWNEGIAIPALSSGGINALETSAEADSSFLPMQLQSQAWIICNVDFLIIPFTQHLYYMIDAGRWWQFHFLNEIYSWATPWPSRALMMPYMKDIPVIKQVLRQAIELKVADWGIDLAFWDDNRVCIRSIPAFMSQLNLNTWIKVFKSNMCIEDLSITHLFTCCNFSAYDVTAKEYEQILKDLSPPHDIEQISAFARVLDNKTCQKAFK